MAHIIEFPKIHSRFGVPPRPAPDAASRQWFFWGIASIAGSAVAPLFLLLSLAIGLWPLLWWLLVADVFIQLVRIVFIGGMSAVLGWLHLSVLAGAAILLALVVNAMANGERGQS